MDRTEAAHLLGVAADASPAEARIAFRALIRRRHPDRAGAAATDESARLIEAHRLLRRPGPPDRDRAGPGSAGADPASSSPTPSPPPWRPGPPVDARVEGDTLLVRAEAATVLAGLVEAGHALGEVTYLDRHSGLVEILVMVQGDDDERPAACSLVASLQGRLDAVEVFCTVERLDGHPRPPIAPLVAALAAEMRAPTSSR